MQIKLRHCLCIIIALIIMVLVFIFTYKNHDYKQTVSYIEEIKEIEEIKKTKIETIETNEEVDIQAVEPVSLGIFKLTAYCSCYICCEKWANNRPVDKYGNEIIYGAIGEKLKEGYSIAVDPSVIPYNTEVIINGNTYKAQDCGGGINGNEIDVYFEDHNRALEFGVQYAEVFVKSK